MSITELPFGASVTAQAPKETPVSHRRRVENFINELGSLLGAAEQRGAELSNLRAQREVAEKVSPDQARELAQRAVQMGQVVDVFERAAAAKARRETVERARELFVDLRIRLEFAEKAYAGWRTAVVEFERDLAGKVEIDRGGREAAIGELKADYERWVELAYQALPGTGIQLL